MKRLSQDKTKLRIIGISDWLFKLKSEKSLPAGRFVEWIGSPVAKEVRFLVGNDSGNKDKTVRKSKGISRNLKEWHLKNEEYHFILYDDSYEQIDFLFQIIIYTLQRKYLNENAWVYEIFRQYLKKLSERGELRFLRLKTSREKEKLLELPPTVEFTNSHLHRKFKPRLGFDPEDINDDVLKQSLKYIISGYFAPYNSNTFGVYVRKTVVFTLRNFELKKEFPTTWRKKYYQPKEQSPDEMMRKEIIEAYCKRKEVHKETGRKWLYRELKKGKSLNDIFCDIFA